MLRAYIESNLAFMRDHRNNVIAMIEIARSVEGRRIFSSDTDVVDAVRALEHLLIRFPDSRPIPPDFDPHVMAIAIRAAIEAASPRLALDPEFDIDNYASEIATLFDLATRIEGGRDGRPRHCVDGRRAAPLHSAAAARLVVRGVVQGHAETAVGVLRDHLAELRTPDSLANEVHLSLPARAGVRHRNEPRPDAAQQIARLLTIRTCRLAL